MSSAVTRRPSSHRKRFSRRILVEKGRRETAPALFSSSFGNRKYSYSILPTRSFAAAPKLLFGITLTLSKSCYSRAHLDGGSSGYGVAGGVLREQFVFRGLAGSDLETKTEGRIERL